VTVARSFGLDVQEPRVLADANNTIVHLRPAALAANLATSSIRDGYTVLVRELALAVHVAKRGGPTPPPATEVPVVVHHQDGLAMTFLRYVERSGADPQPVTTAASLRRLHTALEEFAQRLPSFDSELRELALALQDSSRTPDWWEAIERFCEDASSRSWHRYPAPCTGAILARAILTQGTGSRRMGTSCGSISRPRASAHSNGT
jgi:hypothetical protein